MIRLAGIALIVGGVLFLVAAAFPVTTEVFGASDDPDFQVQAIEDDYSSWQTSSLLFGVAAFIAVIGIGLFAQQIAGTHNDQNTLMMNYAAAALATLGVVFWILVSINRATMEPAELHGNLNINSWWYPVYAILTNLALIIISFVLLRAGYPKWLVGVVLAFGALQFGLQILTGDSIPAINYFPIIILGIVLLRRPVVVVVHQINRATT